MAAHGQGWADRLGVLHSLHSSGVPFFAFLLFFFFSFLPFSFSFSIFYFLFSIFPSFCSVPLDLITNYPILLFPSACGLACI
jgi:hypothetical protein